MPITRQEASANFTSRPKSFLESEDFKSVFEVVRMRVLCIHGMGASPDILERQISSFRAHLPSTWTYDFLEAPRDSGPGPGIEGVYPPPYFCFFDEYSPDGLNEAREYVKEVMEEDGPYDAVLGFSQGASVASALLQPPGTLKFAVFFCAAFMDPRKATPNDIENIVADMVGHIDLPTVHILGKQDSCYSQSLALSKVCEETMSQALVHDGGHDIPRDDATARKIAAAIEKAAKKAISQF